MGLDASAQNYTGTCPIDIVFTATIDGDPGTVFSYQFSGGGFPASKKLYGYIPDSRTAWVNDDINVDAAHAGSFERLVEVSDYGPANHVSPSPRTVKSQKLQVSVICVAPGNTAPPTPPPGGATASPKPSVTSPAASLFGVSVGDDPAVVLARFHLHPPGWARSPPSADSKSLFEVREFPVDNKTDMLLVFDKSIEVVQIRTAPGAAPGEGDSFGVKIGATSEQLQVLRGRPDFAIDGATCSSGCRNIDQLDVLNGLHEPITSDRTYEYVTTGGVRWEYAVKGNAIVSIRIVDCRAAGVCQNSPPPTKPGS